MYTVHISCLYTCTVCDGFGTLVCFRYAVTVCASVQHRLLLSLVVSNVNTSDNLVPCTLILLQVVS